MTKEEYINNGGNNCPCCGSGNLGTEDNVQVDSGSAWQKVHCNDCGAIWNDIWSLTGYEILREPTK